MNEPLVDVKLYGHLRRFGRVFRLAVKTPAEAVRALCHVVKGFEQHLRQNNEPGYRVLVEKTPIAEARELHYPSGRQSIKIVPVVAGAAGGGKIIIGAALIALSFFVPATPLIEGLSVSASSIAFNVGASLVLGGISQMLAGNPAAPIPVEKANNQPSYAFNGPVNLTAQGQCVPVCFGRLRVGSVVISSGLSAAQLAPS